MPSPPIVKVDLPYIKVNEMDEKVGVGVCVCLSHLLASTPLT